MGVHITKAGFKLYTRDSELHEDVERPFNPLRTLSESVDHIDSDVTLADILRLVACDEVLELFFTSYSSCPIKQFCEEIQTAGTKEPEHGEYCEVVFILEIAENPPLNLPKGMDTYWAFQSIGPDGTIYGIDLSPLSDIGGLPIRLNSAPGILALARHPNPYSRETGFTITPTLLQFLNAILWEISFHGGPEERDRRRAELLEIAAEVEAGTAKLIPLDDVLKDLDQ